MLTGGVHSRGVIAGWLSAALLAACGGKSSPTTAPTEQVAAIRIQPNPIIMTAGRDSQLVAIVTDGVGAPIANADVRWSTTNLSVISVSGSGVVHAVAAGVAIVTAVDGPHIGTDSVTVVAASPLRRSRSRLLPLELAATGPRVWQPGVASGHAPQH